jgi:hypothetical protein
MLRSEIQFSRQEIEQIRQFLDQPRLGDIQEQAPGFLPAWTTVFLLLRKLLAYGFYYVPQTDPAISYRDLQRMTTKPIDMLTAVREHQAVFDQLLTIYTTGVR